MLSSVSDTEYKDFLPIIYRPWSYKSHALDNRQLSDRGLLTSYMHTVVGDDMLINASLNLTLVMVKTIASYNIAVLKGYHSSQLSRVRLCVSEPVTLDSRRLTGC